MPPGILARSPSQSVETPIGTSTKTNRSHSTRNSYSQRSVSIYTSPITCTSPRSQPTRRISLQDGSCEFRTRSRDLGGKQRSSSFILLVFPHRPGSMCPLGYHDPSLKITLPSATLMDTPLEHPDPSKLPKLQLFYNTFVRRNSVFVSSIFLGAFAFSITFDLATTAFCESAHFLRKVRSVSSFGVDLRSK